MRVVEFVMHGQIQVLLRSDSKGFPDEMNVEYEKKRGDSDDSKILKDKLILL